MSSTSGDALLARLRADVELKAEVIKALRAEREREGEAVRQQMALLAAVSADLLELSTNVGLLFEEESSGAVQRGADQLKSVCADLADYTAAVNGRLALKRRPLNIGRLLSRIASRHVVDVRVAAPVPERIVADEVQLSRLLSYFVDQQSESGHSESRLLEVTMVEAGAADSDGGAAALPRMQFVLRLAEPQMNHQQCSAAEEQLLPLVGSFDKLRAALVRSLCSLMDAAHSGTVLTVPVQTAADQAHTGIFRLAASELAAASPPGGRSAAAADPAVAHPAIARSRKSNVTSVIQRAAGVPPEATAATAGRRVDEAIDLLYLDRQLGSLASVILARTAPAFLTEVQRRMTDLLVAHECADLIRLECLARAWKGSALSVGARGLAALLDSVEKQAGMGHLPSPAAIWQIRGTLDRVVRALDRQGRGEVAT